MIDAIPNMRICHRKDNSMTGTVILVEENKLSVVVQWDELPVGELDFQWCDKLEQV
jgi:hypothetical protein